MKKILISIVFFGIALSSKGNNSKIYFNSSIGYIIDQESFQGVTTNFGIGISPKKYFGFEMQLDNWYSYAENSASETNTGLSLLLHGYPINFKKSTIDVFLGYGFNMNYWRYQNGGMGRHLFPAPIIGGAYYFSLKRFDLGLQYKRQYFNGLIKKQNQQFLISVKKYF